MKINWLHTVNSIAGAAAVVGGLNPALFGPYAPQAALAIGGATILANVLHAVLGSNSTESLPPPSSGTVVKLHWLTVLMVATLTLMMGCTSTQTFLTSPTGTAVVSDGVAVAIIAAEAKGVSALQINRVAKAVLAADQGTSTTLAALASVVNREVLKAGVPPVDVGAFQILEAEFNTWLIAKYGNNVTVQNVQADVAAFCQIVITDTGG